MKHGQDFCEKLYDISPTFLCVALISALLHWWFSASSEWHRFTLLSCLNVLQTANISCFFSSHCTANYCTTLLWMVDCLFQSHLSPNCFELTCCPFDHKLSCKKALIYLWCSLFKFHHVLQIQRSRAGIVSWSNAANISNMDFRLFKWRFQSTSMSAPIKSLKRYIIWTNLPQ